MTRRTLYLMAIALAFVLLTSSAWAINGDLTKITGNFFSPKPSATTLCAQVAPPVWAEVEFLGITPYDLLFKAGPQYTDSIGRVCVKTTWPQGVYKVEACAEFRDSLRTPAVDGNYSEPVAVSVFNPFRFCGAQGGGALQLFSYDVPPNTKTTLAPRQATFAYIFKLNVPQNYGVWYFDNCGPEGMVEFVAQSFTDIFFDQRQVGNTPYKVVEVYGNGYLSVSKKIIVDTLPECEGFPVHYYIYADDYPGDSSFRIKFWDFAGKLLYQSAPEGEWPETTVFNGKNVISPCP